MGAIVGAEMGIGGLIQTASGSWGGVGNLPLKRCG